MSTGAVVVRRPKMLWRDRGGSYAIEVDGHHVADLRNGRTATIDVEPGHHDVQVRVHSTGSEPVRVFVAPGGTTRLLAEPNPQRHLAASMRQALGRDPWVVLRHE